MFFFMAGADVFDRRSLKLKKLRVNEFCILGFLGYKYQKSNFFGILTVSFFGGYSLVMMTEAG